MIQQLGNELNCFSYSYILTIYKLQHRNNIKKIQILIGLFGK